ncbi:MAG: type III pantothenate kinase [Methylococcales bacterium]|nr:MAG: type III pantothenate kinase [Methylococcales bacterium]
MKLLIDSGNTRLKWATLDEQGVITSQVMLNAQLSRQQLLDAWVRLPRPEQIAIACVSATPLLALIDDVVEDLWPNLSIISVKSEAQAYGVYNAYQQPEKLGVDRWLALIAAHHFYPGAACIVDCGTAVTVDLIDAAGKHQGGLISPGLTLMKKSLAGGTAQLSFNEVTYERGLANCTEAAIYNGTLLAVVGLIEHILSQQVQPVSLILTGGDAEFVAAHLSTNALIDIDLVLRGLSIVLSADLSN